MPDVKGVERRVVRDSASAVLIDDIWNDGRAKPERIRRSLRRRTDIDVEVELSEVTAETARSWQDMEMEPSDATQYRAVVARCNFLSIDRPDIMFASKECSRCMSRPMNGDSEALKRLGRYLLSKSGSFTCSDCKTSPKSCRLSAIPIGPVATRLANQRREHAS